MTRLTVASVVTTARSEALTATFVDPLGRELPVFMTPESCSQALQVVWLRALVGDSSAAQPVAYALRCSTPSTFSVFFGDAVGLGGSSSLSVAFNGYFLPGSPFRISTCAIGTKIGLSGDCDLCPAGSFGNAAGSCAPCPYGLVAPLAGATACQPCPSRLAEPSPSQAGCLCIAGYFQPASNLSECVFCPPGANCSTGYVVSATDLK
eukprot:Amastigsp_a844334_5.p3 type:complete len:207 gc:universal Amastigsp_a844334_5:2339-1719(-)